jgi:hypothetical protein
LEVAACRRLEAARIAVDLAFVPAWRSTDPVVVAGNPFLADLAYSIPIRVEVGRTFVASHIQVLLDMAHSPLVNHKRLVMPLANRTHLVEP